MPKRINHQSDVSLKSDMSDDSIPKLEGENLLETSSSVMDKVRGTCGVLGCYGFATAVGVGLIAYSATHLYICFCAPTGIWGFVQSLVVMDSTFCQVLMGMIHHTQSLYGAMLIAFLFSLIGALGKGIAWMTGGEPGEAPTMIQSRPLRIHQ